MGNKFSLLKEARPLVLTDLPLLTLSETRLGVDTLLAKLDPKLAKVNSKYSSIDPEIFISRFIALNKLNLKFLDIEIDFYNSSGREKGIILKTGRFAGSIPIKSPIDSLYKVDLRVAGSYSKNIPDDDLFNLLDLMGMIQLPEFKHDLNLISSYHRPPNYVECLSFLNLYTEAQRHPWTKFSFKTKTEVAPRGMTDWCSYSMGLSPQEKLKFRNKINYQTTLHDEWRQLNFVLDLCIQELSSAHTPSKIRQSISQTLSKQKKVIQDSKSKIPVIKFKINSHDPVIIKKLKNLGNIILGTNNESSAAWRFDVAEFYERYICYLFSQVSRNYGWTARYNPHYNVQGFKTGWTLNYLEPDLVLQQDNDQIILDAKYKSYLLSGSGNDENYRKDSFRHDLHQILAYASFNPSPHKKVIIAAPFCLQSSENNEWHVSNVRINKQFISSPLSDNSCEVYLLAIPISYAKITEIIHDLRLVFNEHFASSFRTTSTEDIPN